MIKMTNENSQPSASILIIGDEILSGRTLDTNSQYLAEKLNDLGIKLCEVRVISDSKSEIILAIRELKDKYNYVFTSGGIGPTHDDITSESVAEAFNVPISIRDDAKKLLASNYLDGESSLNPARLRMAMIPKNAVLIDNPISKAPGFQLENVFVMAGVPSIFRVMVESLLPKLVGGNPLLSTTIKYLKPEGEIALFLEKIANKYPNVQIGSYPFKQKEIYGTNIVLRHFDRNILKSVEKELKRGLQGSSD